MQAHRRIVMGDCDQGISGAKRCGGLVRSTDQANPVARSDHSRKQARDQIAAGHNGQAHIHEPSQTRQYAAVAQAQISILVRTSDLRRSVSEANDMVHIRCDDICKIAGWRTTNQPVFCLCLGRLMWEPSLDRRRHISGRDLWRLKTPPRSFPAPWPQSPGACRRRSPTA